MLKAAETQVGVFPNVYCPGCKQVVEYKIDELPAKETSQNAQDLVCPNCFYIVATFHER